MGGGRSIASSEQDAGEGRPAPRHRLAAYDAARYVTVARCCHATKQAIQWRRAPSRGPMISRGSTS